MEVDGGMYLAEEEGKGVDVTAGMLPPIKNHLSSFSLQEITTPLTLHQQEQLANTLLSKIQEREDILQSKYTLPDHLEEFRKIFDPPSKLNVRLPIISQLSPRTKSKLSVLPKPNDYELQETRKVEKQIKQLGGKRIYDEITKKYPSTTAVDTTTSPLILLDNVAKGSPEMKKPDHPNSVGNFLIPKYAKTENIVDKKSSEYFEVIERNKKRRAEQELKMAELFGGPSTASQSTTQQAVEEKKSSHGERSHTAGNNTGPLHDVSTPQTSSLQSKTITMLASPFALLAAHQTNNNGSSKGQSKKKSKTKSSVTSSMSALPVPTSSSFYAPPAGGRMLPNPLLVKKHEEVEYLNNFSAKVYDEIGLDLNHAYNRNRKFKQSIQVLMFYWYRCALHTSWIQWKTWIQYLRKKAQNNAVKKITNMFRKLLYYKQKSAKQKYKSLQQDAERKRFMDNQRYLARNAKRIARFIRWIGKMKRIRKLLKFRRAVTKIQKVFRGWKARLFVRIKRRVFMNLVHNVTIVQCIFRLRYAKRRVMVLRKLKFVQDWLIQLDQKKAYYHQIFELNGAEIYIAKAYRTMVIKRRLQKLLYWFHFSKVMLIQRVYRGYVVRRQYRKDVQNKNKREALERISAIKIQAVYRAYHDRCRVMELFQEKHHRDDLRYERKLARLQSKEIHYWHKCKRKMKKVQLFCSSWAVERIKYYHRKATTIQRYWRGHHGRYRFFVTKIRLIWKQVQLHHAKREAKALLIQRRWRGFISRRRFRTQRQLVLVVVIQCAYRVHRAYQRYKYLKQRNEQAKKLTSLLRRLVYKYRFHIKYQRQQYLQQVAVPLQCFFRKCLAKRRVQRKYQQKQRLMEELLVIKTKCIRVLTEIELKILQETMVKPIHSKYYNVSSQECLCYGPLQAIFVYMACQYRNENNPQQPLKIEGKLLPTLKLDASNLIKFLLKLQDMMLPSNPSQAMLMQRALTTTLVDKLFNGVYEVIPSEEKEKNYILHRYYHNEEDEEDKKNGKKGKADNNANNGKDKKKGNAASTSKGKPAPDNSPKKPNSVSSSTKPGKGSNTKNAKNNAKNAAAASATSAATASAPKAHDRIACMVTLQNGDIPMPRIAHLLNQMEIDLIFNKAKNSPASQGNATNKLNYAEFLYVLDLISHMQYEVDETLVEESSLSAASEVTELDEENIAGSEENPEQAVEATAPESEVMEANEEPPEKTPGPLQKQSSTAFNLQHFVKEQVRHINHKSQYINRYNLKVSIPALFTKTRDNKGMLEFKLILLLRMMHAFKEEAFMRDIYFWLEKEAVARLNLFVVKIQSLFRKRIAKKKLIQRRIVRKEKLRMQMIAQLITHVQKRIRGFVGRQRVLKVAQQTLRKYVQLTSTAEPYWFNPKTKVKSWSKPKILGNQDCFTVAVPEEGLEYVVKCIQCALTTAQVYCEECEDSFCKLCYSSLHCKGTRASHHAQAIPMCSYCNYQMATKSCVTCIVKRPPNFCLRATITPYLRGYYCDTCFLYEHDAKTKFLENNKALRAQENRFLTTTKQAYLMQQVLQRKVKTSHQYEPLTQLCEECQSFASTWRCFDCQQVYCSRCLIALHSSNAVFARHQIEELPYYTTEMHQSLMKDINIQIFQEKWKEKKMLARIQRQEYEFHQIVKLQAWWRKWFYGSRGKQFMKKRRAKLRSRYRLRKREEPIRHQWMYCLKDIVGIAPKLLSDNREETILKQIPLVFREKARSYAYKNVEDWGWFRESRTVPKKGIPRVGFAVGEVEELLDQVRIGGYRLPGRVFVVVGNREFKTSCDLTKFLRKGEIVRIRHRYFSVVAIDIDFIKVNRLWREANVDKTGADVPEDDPYALDSKAQRKKKRQKEKLLKKQAVKDKAALEQSAKSQEQGYQAVSEKPAPVEEDDEEENEGEILYRMPTYKTEDGLMYHKAKYMSYDLTIGSVPAQVGLRMYKTYCLRMMKLSLYMMRINKKNKLQAEAAEWRESAVEYADKARWAQSYFNTGDAVVDLSTIDVPESAKKFADYEEEEEGDDAEYENMDLDDLDDVDENGMKKTTKPKIAKKKLPSKTASVHPTEGDEEEDAGGEEAAEGEEEPAEGDEESPKKPKSALKKTTSSAALSTTSSRRSRLSKAKRGAADDSEKSSKPSTTSKKSRNLFSASSKAEEMSARTAMKSIKSIEAPKIAEKRIKDPNRKLKAFKKMEKEPWYATAEQLAERKAREDKMTPHELAAEAIEWKECIDVMTENVYWINQLTNEMMTTCPRSITTKKQVDFEESRNKKSYDDAQKRIQRLEMVTKNRLLLSGYRKR